MVISNKLATGIKAMSCESSGKEGLKTDQVYFLWSNLEWS